MRQPVQKPFGPFEDFKDCVSTLLAENDDLSEEDAHEICGAMEENPDDFFSSVAESAEAILRDLKVTFVSGVDEPAQDSEFVFMKSSDGDVADLMNAADWTRNRDLLVKADPEEGEERKTWAPVLIPGEVDKQGDVVPQAEIEKAAHDFLKNFRNVDTDHELLSGKGEPIESWTTKEERSFIKHDGEESRVYPEGTWMLGIEWSEEAWEAIKAGEISGLSIFGQADALDPEAIAELTSEEREARGMSVKAFLYGKSISRAEHQEVSDLIEQFFEEVDADMEAGIDALEEWAMESNEVSDEDEDLLMDHLDRFREELPDDVQPTVGEFIGFLAQRLEEEQEEGGDGQTEDGEEQQAQRRAVFDAASQLKSIAKADSRMTDGTSKAPDDVGFPAIAAFVSAHLEGADPEDVTALTDQFEYVGAVDLNELATLIGEVVDEDTGSVMDWLDDQTEGENEGGEGGEGEEGEEEQESSLKEAEQALKQVSDDIEEVTT